MFYTISNQFLKKKKKGGGKEKDKTKTNIKAKMLFHILLTEAIEVKNKTG